MPMRTSSAALRGTYLRICQRQESSEDTEFVDTRWAFIGKYCNRYILDPYFIGQTENPRPNRQAVGRGRSPQPSRRCRCRRLPSLLPPPSLSPPLCKARRRPATVSGSRFVRPRYQTVFVRKSQTSYHRGPYQPDAGAKVNPRSTPARVLGRILSPNY